MASFDARHLRHHLVVDFQPRFKFLNRDVGRVLGNFLKLEIKDFILDHGFNFEFMLESLNVLLSRFSGMKEITFVGKMPLNLELADNQQIEWYKKKIN